MITIDHLVRRIMVRTLPTCLHLRSANFSPQVCILHVAVATSCRRTSILRVSTVTFLPIALKPSIVEKPMKRRFQQCIVRTEILSTFHVRVQYISVTKYAIQTIGPMEANYPKIHPSLQARGLHLIHECLG